MSAETLLARCEKVRRTGPGRWVCCCPAHNDKTPSMNVKEEADGRVLIICRAGCSALEILDAAGLEWDALFPEKPVEFAKSQARPFPAADVLEATAGEMLVAWIITRDIEAGLTPSQDDFDRLTLANSRVQAALDAIGR